MKSRVGFQMIIDAEREGKIKVQNPDSATIIEATGGNTGIGIAQICALRGYRCILVVPDNYSMIRVNILKELGADVIMSDHTLGNDSHIQLAQKIVREHPDYIYLNQFSNPSSIKAHYEGTGKEILSQVNERIEYFVAGIGTGGTLFGAGRRIKENYPDCNIVGVQPWGCDVVAGTALPHIIQGIAIGQKLPLLDKKILDCVYSVCADDVMDMKSRLSKELGLYLGFSSAANIVAAINIAKQARCKSAIVTIAPDGGKNY